MKILSRYILTESLANFAICLTAFTGLLLTARILKFTNLIVNKGVETKQIVMVFVAIIPTFLEIAIPMATLLGIMMAFGRLSGDSEVVVIRASGISLLQLISPVLLFGLCAFAASSYISFSLRPWGYKKLSRTLFEIARTKSTAGLDKGVFNKLGTLTLYADEIDDKSGRLKNVLIDDKRDRERRQVIISRDGLILSDSVQQTISINLANGVIHELIDGSYALTEFKTNSITLSADELYNPDAKKGNRRFREMSRAELIQERIRYNKLIAEYVEPAKEQVPESAEVKAEGADLLSQQEQADATKTQESTQETDQKDKDKDKDKGSKADNPFFKKKLSKKELNKRRNKLQIELIRRYSMPFASLLLALVAMPLGIQPPRAQKAWGVTISVLLGMGVFVCYYGILSIGVALGESGTISPYIGLWLPNVVTALGAAYFHYNMGTERWQSIVQGLEDLITPLFRRLGLKKRVAS